MEEKQFIGIYPNAVPIDLCNLFVEWFDDLSKHGITMSTTQDQGYINPLSRKDEVIGIPLSLPTEMFRGDLCKPLWQIMFNCYNSYSEEYGLEVPSTSNDFKVHRVQPTGGYHIWHHEHGYLAPYRILAWMVVLEAPEEGGETEFLHQSLRIDPKVGQLVIWPAFFTHKHRGNPPLKGQKTYVTGWFDLIPDTAGQMAL